MRGTRDAGRWTPFKHLYSFLGPYINSCGEGPTGHTRRAGPRRAGPAKDPRGTHAAALLVGLKVALAIGLGQACPEDARVLVRRMRLSLSGGSGCLDK